MIQDTTDTPTLRGDLRHKAPVSPEELDGTPDIDPEVDSETLKTDVQKLGQHLKEDSRELVEDVKRYAKSQVIDPAIAKARGKRAQASLKVNEAELRMRRKTEEAKHLAETEYRRGLEMVRERPAAAVAIAAIAGAILGRFLLKR